MMAIVNLGAVLEYGRPNAAMRRVSGLATRDAHQTKPGVSPMVANAVAGKVKLMAKRAEEDEKSMDVDDEDDTTEPKPSPMRTSPIMPEPPSSPELPQSLKMGLLLSFSMFAHVLEKPMRKPSPFAHSTLNPYITIFLTFLATTVKDSQTLAALERVIPWTALVKFLNSAPRRLIFREYHKERGDAPPLLTSGCNPMPEDWCLRGMGWGGKRVYPMGFWSKEADSGERNIEMEVLDKVEAGDQRDGIIEKDDDDSRADSRDSELMKRWVRIARAGLKIAKYVNGFEYIPPAREEERGQWRIGGALAAKVTRWQDEDRREREEEERRLRGRRWDDDSMDVDDDEGLAADTSSDDTEDDEYDSAEVKALKVSYPCLNLPWQSAKTLDRRDGGISRAYRQPRAERRRLQGAASVLDSQTLADHRGRNNPFAPSPAIVSSSSIPTSCCLPYRLSPRWSSRSNGPSSSRSR